MGGRTPHPPELAGKPPELAGEERSTCAEQPAQCPGSAAEDPAAINVTAAVIDAASTAHASCIGAGVSPLDAAYSSAAVNRAAALSPVPEAAPREPPHLPPRRTAHWSTDEEVARLTGKSGHERVSSLPGVDMRGVGETPEPDGERFQLEVQDKVQLLMPGSGSIECVSRTWWPSARRN